MATTTNYGWTTPDDTALVKDGASAIRTLGTSVDTTTKNLNPETTLGDIAYRSSTANVKTRLGIGTTGQVLAVSGGVPAWTTPAGGSTNFALLNAGGTNLTGAQKITVSGISSKSKVFIFVENMSSVSDNATCWVTLNNDTGSNYLVTRGTQTAAEITAQSSIGSATTEVDLFKIGNAASDTGSGWLLVDNANSTNYKQLLFNGFSNGNGGTQRIGGGGFYTGASAITQIEINCNLGNFDAGKVYVYTTA